MNIPPGLEKFVSPQTSKETRLMAAKAALPMGAKDIVAILSILLSDTDSEVSETARKSLEGMPSHLLLTVLDGDLDPLVIKTVVNIHKDNDAVLVMAALNRNTDDETLAFMASNSHEGVANVIAENQTRLMRSPSLLDALKTNPSVGKSVIDRVTAFLISVGRIMPKEAVVPAPAVVEPPQIKEIEKEAVLPGEEAAAVNAELKIEKEAAFSRGN